MACLYFYFIQKHCQAVSYIRMCYKWRLCWHSSFTKAKIVDYSSLDTYNNCLVCNKVKSQHLQRPCMWAVWLTVTWCQMWQKMEVLLTGHTHLGHANFLFVLNVCSGPRMAQTALASSHQVAFADSQPLGRGSKICWSSHFSTEWRILEFHLM